MKIKERIRTFTNAYVVDGEACEKFVQWTPGNSKHYCQKHFQLWQQQINTHHLGDDRTGVHNNGIIVNASTSIWQQEMNQINRLCNHVPRIQLIQAHTKMV